MDPKNEGIRKTATFLKKLGVSPNIQALNELTDLKNSKDQFELYALLGDKSLYLTMVEISLLIPNVNVKRINMLLQKVMPNSRMASLYDDLFDGSLTKDNIPITAPSVHTKGSYIEFLVGLHLRMGYDITYPICLLLVYTSFHSKSFYRFLSEIRKGNDSEWPELDNKLSQLIHNPHAKLPVEIDLNAFFSLSWDYIFGPNYNLNKRVTRMSISKFEPELIPSYYYPNPLDFSINESNVVYPTFETVKKELTNKESNNSVKTSKEENKIEVSNKDKEMEKIPYESSKLEDEEVEGETIIYNPNTNNFSGFDLYDIADIFYKSLCELQTLVIKKDDVINVMENLTGAGANQETYKAAISLLLISGRMTESEEDPMSYQIN